MDEVAVDVPLRNLMSRLTGLEVVKWRRFEFNLEGLWLLRRGLREAWQAEPASVVGQVVRPNVRLWRYLRSTWTVVPHERGWNAMQTSEYASERLIELRELYRLRLWARVTGSSSSSWADSAWVSFPR